MEIKNVTKYSEELNKIFQKLNFKRLLPLQLICSAVLAVCAVIAFVMDDIENGIFSIFMMVFFNGLVYFSFLIARKLVNKSNRLMQEAPTQSYVFRENEIEIQMQSASASSTSTLSYGLVSSVIISKRITLMFINKVQAYIIDNEGFLSGSREEFIDLLKRKVDVKKIKTLKK